MKIYAHGMKVKGLGFCCMAIYREFEKGDLKIFHPSFDRESGDWSIVVRWRDVEIWYCPFCGAKIERVPVLGTTDSQQRVDPRVTVKLMDLMQEGRDSES